MTICCIAYHWQSVRKFEEAADYLKILIRRDCVVRGTQQNGYFPRDADDVEVSDDYSNSIDYESFRR